VKLTFHFPVVIKDDISTKWAKCNRNSKNLTNVFHLIMTFIAAEASLFCFKTFRSKRWMHGANDSTTLLWHELCRTAFIIAICSASSVSSETGKWHKNKINSKTTSQCRRFKAVGDAVWGSNNTLIRSITWFNCLCSLGKVPAVVSSFTWHDTWSLYNVAISPVRQDADGHLCLQ